MMVLQPGRPMLQKTDRQGLHFNGGAALLRRFTGRPSVIKYGGHAMLDETLKQSFAMDITLMNYIASTRWWSRRRPAIEEMLKNWAKPPASLTA